MSEIRDIFNKHADSDKATGLCFMSFLRLPNNNHNYNCCHHYHHFFLPAGIVSLMNRFLNILSKEDYELAQQINLKQGIKPHYYAFRWITLMLSQEFSLPGTYVFLWTQLICAALQTWTANKQWTLILFFICTDVLRLWDYLFSDEHRFEFLLKLCCSMILWVSFFILLKL